ncbi:short-chain dehydrogenase reductase [Fusarium pseudoanthophilum]|uniref:Short-chain dehydrogenase reductase n=1 Tax=Fusarium pseudoanthophilum TaxID=48495 RepID=A0A8H5PPI7_9HYPO|nr:short-chain dehydrogenase reductase [Fusarium pseudoanthophilum]
MALSKYLSIMNTVSMEQFNELRNLWWRNDRVRISCIALIALIIFRKAHRLLSQAALNNFVSDTYDWRKELVVVTGGSGGLGSLLVHKLARNSIRVISIDVKPSAVPLHVRRIFDVNVIANFLLVKEFLPAMIKRNHGHIINIASMASFVTGVRNVDYAASKVGVLALHEGLAQELKHSYKAPKVRISIVHPTYIRTPMMAKVIQAKAFASTLLEPEAVVDKLFNHIINAKSGQVFIPDRLWTAAGMRGWPAWLQALVRRSQRYNMSITRDAQYQVQYH